MCRRRRVVRPAVGDERVGPAVEVLEARPAIRLGPDQLKMADRQSVGFFGDAERRRHRLNVSWEWMRGVERVGDER